MKLSVFISILLIAGTMGCTKFEAGDPGFTDSLINGYWVERETVIKSSLTDAETTCNIIPKPTEEGASTEPPLGFEIRNREMAVLDFENTSNVDGAKEGSDTNFFGTIGKNGDLEPYQNYNGDSMRFVRSDNDNIVYLENLTTNEERITLEKVAFEKVTSMRKLIASCKAKQ